MYIIEDTSFIVSVINSLDELHTEAFETLDILNSLDKPIYVFPSIVIAETVVTLVKSGIHPDTVREKINYLSMLRRVIIQSTDPITVLRYCSRYYNHLIDSNPSSIIRTNDYCIACAAIDYSAPVIASDKKMIRNLQRCHIPCYDFSSQSDRDKLADLALPF